MGLFGFLKKDKKEESSSKTDEDVEFMEEDEDNVDAIKLEEYLNSDELSDKQKQQRRYAFSESA